MVSYNDLGNECYLITTAGETDLSSRFLSSK